MKTPRAKTAETAKSPPRPHPRNLFDPTPLERGSGDSHRKSMRKEKFSVATTPAATLEELAQRVGRCTRTLQRQAKNPDAPKRLPDGRHDVAAWQTFLQENGRDMLPDTPEIRALKARKLLAEVEEKEHRLAVMRRQFVRKDAVIERWNFHTQRCAAVLLEMADSFAGEIVGLDAVEIRKAGEQFVDAFTMRMRTGT